MLSLGAVFTMVLQMVEFTNSSEEGIFLAMRALHSLQGLDERVTRSFVWGIDSAIKHNILCLKKNADLPT